MKKSAFIWGAVAIFVGVFGALQIDRALTRNSSDVNLRLSETLRVIPASFEAQSGAATTLPDFRAAARRVIPSVVSVDRFSRMETLFGEDLGLRETGTGSGVILSREGVIVTNNHVVDRAAQVRVKLSDGRSFTAEVLGKDPRTDLAVLRIRANNLTPIQVGDNSKIEVGQWVMAVGNPLGFESTVSVGVVSSLNRSLTLPGAFLINGIQTDAAINPGNSGGALTDASGRLVGINSAIASNTQGNIGIGFSIPIRRVQKVVSDILEYGRPRDGVLGISWNPRHEGILEDESVRRQLERRVGPNIPREGMLIDRTSGPAEAAGLQRFDVLLEVDGRKVTDGLSLNQALIDRSPGDRVRIRYWSRGQVKTAEVRLAESATRV